MPITLACTVNLILPSFCKNRSTVLRISILCCPPLLPCRYLFLPCNFILSIDAQENYSIYVILLQSVSRLPPPPSLLFNGYRVLALGLKGPRREIYPWPQSIVKVRNGWSCTSIFPDALLAWTDTSSPFYFGYGDFLAITFTLVPNFRRISEDGIKNACVLAGLTHPLPCKGAHHF